MNKKLVIVIVSTVCLAAICLSGCVTDVNEIMADSEPATLRQDESLEGSERLEANVEMGVGNLEISRGDADQLYDLRIDYDGANNEPEVNFDRGEGTAELKVCLDSEKGSGWWIGDNRISLELSPEVDLDATFVTGVGDNLVDLTGLKIERLEVINGVGESEIHMDENNKISCGSICVTNGIGSLEMTGIGNFSFSDFNFTGGIGESTLDFSGDWNSIGDINIKVGMGSLKVMLPEDLPVRIKTSKSFLSSLDLPGFKQVGNEYQSGDVDGAERMLLIRLNTGIGDVRFVHR